MSNEEPDIDIDAWMRMAREKEPARRGMTITEFLLARITEDEALAESAANLSNGGRWWVDPNAVNSGKHWIYDVGEKFADRPVADYIARHDPERVLAECAAKRAIVRMARRVNFPDQIRRGKFWDGQRVYAKDVLRELASVYADHPDYDEAWRI